MQDCSNCSALAMELLQSRTEPSIYSSHKENVPHLLQVGQLQVRVGPQQGQLTSEDILLERGSVFMISQPDTLDLVTISGSQTRLKPQLFIKI